MDDEQHLKQLISAKHTCISIVTFEEDHALALLRNVAMELGRPLLIWSVSGGVQDALVTGKPPVPETEDPVAGLAHFAGLTDQPICATLDLADHLRNERVLRVFRNLAHQLGHAGNQLVMIDYRDDVPDIVASYATRMEISLPTEKELEKLVAETLRRIKREMPIVVNLRRREAQAVVRNLCGLSRRQAEQIIRDCVADDQRFDASDINHILAQKRRALQGAGLLEYIETPVDLHEIGGLRRLKRWLSQRQNALSDQAVRFGLNAPRGVLMLGVQGAGKSLCAKAIATAWRRPLLRMDVGALYDRYIGESERRLRDALKQAEMMAPIILWIDEIEKAFASAASRSNDGGLSQRMFGSLLTWMQEHEAPVFLVATANDIEALPPELLRKGRFDEIFFVDLPRKIVRRDIFVIHLRKRKRDPKKFDLNALAEASKGFSGAEIEQAVISAMHDAFAGKTKLRTEHVLKTLEASPPLSVTMAERVAGLREWAASRCMPAD